MYRKYKDLNDKVNSLEEKLTRDKKIEDTTNSILLYIKIIILILTVGISLIYSYFPDNTVLNNILNFFTTLTFLVAFIDSSWIETFDSDLGLSLSKICLVVASAFILLEWLYTLSITNQNLNDIITITICNLVIIVCLSLYLVVGQIPFWISYLTNKKIEHASRTEK